MACGVFHIYFQKKFLLKGLDFFQCFQVTINTWLSDLEMKVTSNLEAIYLTPISERISFNSEKKSPSFQYWSFPKGLWIFILSISLLLISFYTLVSSHHRPNFTFSVLDRASFTVSQICLLPWPFHQLI